MGDLHFHHPGYYEIRGEILIRLDDSMAGRFDELKAMLTERANEIMATSQAVLQQITGIKDAVVALKTYEEGRNQQVDELKARVKELMDADATEQADIDAAFDGLKSTEADIRAIFAGTPVDPVTGV